MEKSLDFLTKEADVSGWRALVLNMTPPPRGRISSFHLHTTALTESADPHITENCVTHE